MDARIPWMLSISMFMSKNFIENSLDPWKGILILVLSSDRVY